MTIAELRALMGKAIYTCDLVAQSGRDDNSVADVRFDANDGEGRQHYADGLYYEDAHYLVALVNNAERLLAVCEAAQKYAMHSEVCQAEISGKDEDCDCPRARIMRAIKEMEI